MRPTAILSADLHLRDTIPKCRTDDFFFTVERKFIFELKLARKYKCPLLIAGDLGEESEWPNWFIRWFIYTVRKFKVKIYCIPGQHDLKWNSLKQWKRSAIGILGTSKVINLIGIKPYVPIELEDFIIVPFPFGHPIKKIPLDEFDLPDKPLVAMSHQLVLKDNPLWPGGGSEQGVHLLKKYPEYNLILTGDNHNPFVARYKNRKLVNPGSMTRHKADQIKHRPRIYLWYAEENKVRRVYIPIEKGVISRSHIKAKEKRSKKMEEYVEKMRTGYNKSASYKDNLKNHFRENKINKPVIERVLESCQDLKKQ